MFFGQKYHVFFRDDEHNYNKPILRRNCMNLFTRQRNQNMIKYVGKPCFMQIHEEKTFEKKIYFQKNHPNFKVNINWECICEQITGQKVPLFKIYTTKSSLRILPKRILKKIRFRTNFSMWLPSILWKTL